MAHDLQTDPTSQPAHQESARSRPSRAELLAKLDGEIRVRNVQLLKISILIFNPIYVLWTTFDYLLAPEQWGYFLLLRIAASGANSLLLIPLMRRHKERPRTLEWFWLWFLVWGGFVAPMLPFTGDAFLPYILGLGIVLFGVGAVPYWPPRWALTNMLCIVTMVYLAFFIWPAKFSSPEGPAVVGGIFFIGTIFVISMVTVWFKYSLLQAEFFTRQELEEEKRVTEVLRQRDQRKSEDLAAALDRLKELDRLKSQFFANISHELRTPLTLILGPLEDLLSKDLNAEMADQLRVIRNNAGRLLRLIDELLDLARLDAGGLRLNIAEVDMRALAASVFENAQPMARTRSIRFELDAPEATSEVFGDTPRLEIIVTNLVGNALKYVQEQGHIILRVRESADSASIEVSDDGPGIPSVDVPHVFERFYQVGEQDRRKRRRRTGGVGIGLALAKELAELHDGKLSVASTLGEGSCFTLWLPKGREHFRPEVIERRKRFDPVISAGRRLGDPKPAKKPLHKIVPKSDSSRRRGQRSRILVVEDQDELRAFLVQLLQPSFEVIEALDGEEGLKLVRKLRPDLVISDVMMPRLSGTELCRSLKNDPALRSIPTILLTARVGSEATLEAYAQGADDFIPKPFHPGVLVARVRAQLKMRSLSLQLIGQEKLAAVGTLAAGVAHEVQNPLNAVLNAGRALAGGRFDEQVSSRLLKVIIDGSERIDAIVRALSNHVRPAEGRGAVMPFDLRKGIDATVVLLEHRMQDIEVHRDYGTDACALVPVGPVNQVLLNLVDNAVRAEVRNIWLSTEQVDETLRIHVRDDGPGVHEAIADRIFDPFFTTREPGEGTGLGLFLSRKIVTELGGELSLERSDPAATGAHFVLDLPLQPLAVADSRVD